MAPKQIEFTVIKTNIADENNNKVKVGQRIMLGKEMAEHYNKLGYIDIPLPDFGEDEVIAEETKLNTTENSPLDEDGTEEEENASTLGTTISEPSAGAGTAEATDEATSTSPETEVGTGNTSKRRRL